MFFLNFSMHYDRDKGLDEGRLILRHLQIGTIEVWTATSSTQGNQGIESFHNKGGLIPPEYRCGIANWQVVTTPIYMPQVQGVNGNFFKINPHEVTTDKGGKRGDFGIHEDTNAPGSLGCIVMNETRFKSFEKRMEEIEKKGFGYIPLFVTYS